MIRPDYNEFGDGTNLSFAANSFLLTDVEAVLADDFFRRGTVYFDGVWTQTNDDSQRTLLKAMAKRDEPWPLAELGAATGLAPDALQSALRWAGRHDIIRSSQGEAGWEFYVPLMRRWIGRRGE